MELLVVIAIIGVLVSLLLPSLAQVQIRTRDIKCLSNFHHIGLATKDYVADHQVYPPRAVAYSNSQFQAVYANSTLMVMGGADPVQAIPYVPLSVPAAYRPLYRYQSFPQIFRCPMDAGTLALNDWPWTNINAKPSLWETIGCSYQYNVSYLAPKDSSRSPPLPPITKLGISGSLALKREEWVLDPARFILLTEPPARPLGRRYSNTNFHPIYVDLFWTQWHRTRGITDFGDPTIAPRLFVSPVLFIDGHAAVHDFSSSIMNDPYYPFEKTKDWQWYQPR